ncbi:MAG: SH3 domain-containing protein [Chloroflexia bacterium]|nr:SH3 domain-containing protein [Chloroflexia bacterium]
MPYVSEHPHDSHDQSANGSLSRRAVIGKGLVASAAIIAATAGARGVTANDAGAEDNLAATTAALNLRAGAGPEFRVITVMPKGATITLQRVISNDYHYVSYKGQLGWAHRDYVVARPYSPPPDPVITGRAKTLYAVNLRSGPSTGHRVLRVLPAGSTVDTSSQLHNGFRYVVHQGLAGWIADQYLYWPFDGVETFTTTARLNLRERPSTSARVLTIMPEGATVYGGSGTAPGFRQVTYKGTTGWAATAYLN